MEVWTAAAAAICIVAASWKLSEMAGYGCDASSVALSGALTWAGLCAATRLLPWGAALFCCCFAGFWVTARRRKLLPAQDRAVLVTGLWALVNNAGVLHCPAVAELQPLATFRRCMDVNFLSAVHMCQLFLPLLRRSRGRIVNVSSMAGEVPMPMLGAYGASKAAVSILSRVMRLELAAWGVKVALIQPAGFRTNIFGDGGDVARYKDELLAAASPEAREDYGEAYISSAPRCLSIMAQQSAVDLSPVVEDMFHAVLSVCPRPLYTPGEMGWLLPFLHRCCPTSWFDAIIARLPHYSEGQPAGLRT
ncbi:17-beta-hydroxysteroid dehydrogenase type 2 isoform X3 [Odontesthes bonariensis]|uniref:17-beta-hydroxysteroid dehydrogenase type 2 isoform X3 n=1 Tax=Odontesthes bonariensis TaxID=219752 RepID=UPI003F58993B